MINLDGQLRDFAANWIKAGDNDGLWGVVDNKVNACGLLDRADVAALASDDASLQVLAWQCHHCNSRVTYVLAADSLYGEAHDRLGPFVGLVFGVGLDLTDKFLRVLFCL
jgi:hypothetical protein